MTVDDELDLTFGNWLFAQECSFIGAFPNTWTLPDMSLPEVAFVGRSNVGKSSLVNALTNRKTLAKTSNTPGRTQELVYFNLGQKLILVDMPGYGYAKASKTKVASWNDLILDYLKGRASLKRVYVLIDSRHGLKETDRDLMKILDKSAVSYHVILTKGDKTPKTELQALEKSMMEELKFFIAAYPGLISTSSEKKTGVEELRATIAEFAK
jgi:GTP-binding protein